jgi:3',5'-cyclic AMP phosphodiesterase CpdA
MRRPSDAQWRIAVIADPHIHEPRAAFGAAFAATGGLALRPLADAARVGRVFNETGPAFDHAVAAIAARGIRDIVLLGDVSDDGQRATMAALSLRLARLAARHGVRFHALPGNHDTFGDRGRHRTRRFLSGSPQPLTLTSRAAAPDPATLAGRLGLYCDGGVAGLGALAAQGPIRRPGDLYWETPFGTDPDPERRSYAMQDPAGGPGFRLFDASYLVEPLPGLWLLMADANVFVPHPAAERARHDEDFADAGEAGWDAVLAHRPYLFDWIADVAARARLLGKRLALLSHYPVADAFGPATAIERALTGPTAMLRRWPGPAVAARLAAAGVDLHVGGHQHVNATTAAGGLTDIAVPSLAAFPGAFKILTLGPAETTVETLTVGDMALPPDLRAAYAEEARHTPRLPQAMLDAATYGDFLTAHLRHLVARRFLRRDWPATLAAAVPGLKLADLSPATPDALAAMPVTTFLQDYTLIRAGGDLALPLIAPSALAAYPTLAASARRDGTPAAAIATLLTAFAHLAARLPSDRFTIGSSAWR